MIHGRNTVLRREGGIKGVNMRKLTNEWIHKMSLQAARRPSTGSR
jgi:hypothetical protein